MAGVFDIDLDQPEENVSDDELEEASGFPLHTLHAWSSLAMLGD